MSRAKTFKKSLRESFRRLRKGRGAAAATPAQEKKTSPKKTAKTPPESPKKEEGAASGQSPIEASPAEAEAEGAAAPAPTETVETGDTSTKPVEREITARSEKVSATEEMSSMVRCAMFADTFVMHCNFQLKKKKTN